MAPGLLVKHKVSQLTIYPALGFLDTNPLVSYIRLDVISKMRLSAHGGVAGRLKMLTYLRVCSAFSPPRALS